jgi:hypothetical protein
MAPLYVRSRPCALALILTVLACLGGCGQPSDEARQNRRLLDAVLTAVTTKNRKELIKDEALVDKCHSEGRLSEKPYKALKAIIEKARSGNWSQAEDELYKYRESDPFPK